MIPQDVPMTGKLSENLMLSGGAAGADTYFGKVASAAGHQVIHWSFEGHKSHDPDNTVKLDDETLREADIHLETARLSMKRKVPYGKPHIANLLRRNYFQVQHVQSVYAVGMLKDKAVIKEQSSGQMYNGSRSDNMGVSGGTAWACQMYHDIWVEENIRLQGEHQKGISSESSNRDHPFFASPANWFPPFQLLFYDQEKRDIFVYNCVGQHWIPLNVMLGRPSGIYAAIGTRKLNNYGKTFIEELYNR